MQNLEFPLQPSKIHVFLLYLLLFASILIILFISVNSLLKLLLLMAVMWYGKSLLMHASLKHPDSIISIKKTDHGEWLLQTNSERHSLNMTGSSTVTSLISVLRFRLPDKRSLTAVILSDSLQEPVAYRCLLKAIY